MRNVEGNMGAGGVQMIDEANAVGNSEVIQEELALTDVRVFGTPIEALMDTGATPN